LRILVPLAAVELAAGDLFPDAAYGGSVIEMMMIAFALCLAYGSPLAPLLEKERNASGQALIAERSEPTWM